MRCAQYGPFKEDDLHVLKEDTVKLHIHFPGRESSHQPPEAWADGGKPGGNPCRPRCLFEVALQAAATGGAKYGTATSSVQKTLTQKSKHSRCRPEAKLLCRLSPNVNTRVAKQHLRCAIRASRNAESNRAHVHSLVHF